jgi:hypothetical protein
MANEKALFLLCLTAMLAADLAEKRIDNNEHL